MISGRSGKYRTECLRTVDALVLLRRVTDRVALTSSDCVVVRLSVRDLHREFISFFLSPGLRGQIGGNECATKLDRSRSLGGLSQTSK
jgi:hypothetical protein